MTREVVNGMTLMIISSSSLTLSSKGIWDDTVRSLIAADPACKEAYLQGLGFVSPQF